MTPIIIGLVIAVTIFAIFRTKKILPYCFGILTFCSILGLDSMFIHWALEDVTQYRNLIEFGLWIIVLMFSGAFSAMFAVFIGAIVSAVVSTYKS